MIRDVEIAAETRSGVAGHPIGQMLQCLSHGGEFPIDPVRPFAFDCTIAADELAGEVAVYPITAKA